MLGYTIAKYPSESHHDAIKIGDNYLYLSNSEYGVQDRITIIDKNGNYIKELKFGPLIKNALDINKYKEDENTFKEIAYGEDVDNIY